MSSQPSAAIPSVGETFGACYIGSVIAAILFGISTLQMAIYYQRYPNDWWVYRYSVAVLWVFDTFHVVLSTHALYFYLITDFGNFIGDLESDLWSMKWQLCLNNFLVVFVQWFYAIRIWKLGRHFHKILPWFVILAVAASTGTNIYATYETSLVPNLLSVSIITKSVYIVFSTISAADLIIASMMCYYLHKCKREIMHSTTVDILLRLMRLVLISGVATSAISLSTLIAYIVWPGSLIFVGIHFVLAKLYINSLLAMLNSRSKHHSTNRATVVGVNSLPFVLRIPPRSSEGNADETNINIPLRHIGSFGAKLDPTKEDLDC